MSLLRTLLLASLVPLALALWGITGLLRLLALLTEHLYDKVAAR